MGRTFVEPISAMNITEAQYERIKDVLPVQRGVTFSDKWRVFFNIIWRRTCVLGNRLSCHTSRSSKVRNSPQRMHWPDVNS